ncbi:MAG: hypothetical protein DRN29_06715 [Thermoplasmata archaeon]|nr:MAG: hypothetical protein DRN29_06715 [Thermoplasmata archaeon]
MGWDEIEIERLIKSNRNFLDKEIGRKYESPSLFINPTKENPVEISEFLSHLNLSFLDSSLKKMFPRLERIKKGVYARVKFVVFMKLSNIKYISEAYRKLITNKKIAQNLGFDPSNLSSYETIRHFVNDLLSHKIEEIFNDVVKELEKRLKRKGKWIGDIVEDATVITAKRMDKEAKYSRYYKTYGWKKDLFIESNGIFLSYKDLEINDDEGRYMEYHLKKLNQLSIFINHITTDGKYATYYNVAMTKCHYDAEFLYKPQKGWVYNKKGEERYIKERYSRYWKEKGFKANASIDYKLKFLYNRGEYEIVGAYYRNKRMKEWEENDNLRKRYAKERNSNEGFNSYLKNHAGFETNLHRKGKRYAFFHTTLCLLVLNLVALTRLQNGVTDNLISVAYLT